MADRLIRIRTVIAKTGNNTTDIYAGMKAGTFPKSVPIGKRTVGWVEAEIDGWIADRIKSRDNRDGRKAGPGRGHKGSPHSASVVEAA